MVALCSAHRAQPVNLSLAAVAAGRRRSEAGPNGGTGGGAGKPGLSAELGRLNPFKERHFPSAQVVSPSVFCSHLGLSLCLQIRCAVKILFSGDAAGCWMCVKPSL